MLVFEPAPTTPCTTNLSNSHRSCSYPWLLFSLHWHLHCVPCIATHSCTVSELASRMRCCNIALGTRHSWRDNVRACGLRHFGFDVNLPKFLRCSPEFRFCRLSQAVKQQTHVHSSWLPPQVYELIRRKHVAGRPD